MGKWALLFFLLLIPSVHATKFKDVPEAHWAAKPIEKLVDIGIVDGYEDGTFRGRKTVTRYELALYLSHITQYYDKKYTQKIQDLQAQIDELKHPHPAKGTQAH